jgi:hypothetical protein
MLNIYRDVWRAVVKENSKPSVSIKGTTFFDQLSEYHFPKRDCDQWT